jgi:non-specific serine/threonine protein kinase
MSLVGGQFEARVEAMTAEYANIHAALDWTARERPSIEAAITESVHWYWMLRGMLAVAKRHLESVLSKDAVDQATMARLCLLASTVAHRGGDYDAISGHVERAAALAERADDPALDVWITASRGLLAAQQADWTTAEALFRRLVDLSAQLPTEARDGLVRMHGWPPSRARHMMMARNNLAMTLLQLGRNHEALCEAQQAVEAATEVFERSIAIAPVLETCGQAYLALERTGEAREQFTAALSHAVDLGNDHLAVSPLVGLARSAAMEGDFASCLTFAAAGRRAARLSGTKWFEGNSDQVKPIVNAENDSRAALGEDGATAAWGRGASIGIRAALELARGSRLPSPPPLSNREWDVAHLVARGLADKEIARSLSISSRTVEVHLARVRQKLGLHNRAEVAVWAVTHGVHE